MKVNRVLCLLLGSWLLLGACHDSKENPLPNEEESRTVLAYIVGDNNLSSFLPDDALEMMEGLEQMNGINGHLLVYADMGSKPTLLELYRKGSKVDYTIIQEFESNRNSVGVEEMKEVLSIAFSSKYQANHYGLVLWSHGDAWYPYPLPSASSRWIGQDKSNGDDRMNVDELAEALQSVPHLDFLMLDLCFGGSIELMYEIKEYADYIIASPTEIPGPGAPYDQVVMQMFNTAYTGTDYVLPMARAYFDHYNNLYDENSICTNDHWTGGVSVAMLKCSELTALARATRTVWTSGTVDIEKLKQMVLDYDKRSNYPSSYVGYFDLWQIVEEVATDEAVQSAWKQAFAAAVPYFQTTPRNYSAALGHTFSMEGSRGVSCYLPKSDTDKAMPFYRTLAWYQDAGLSSLGW